MLLIEYFYPRGNLSVFDVFLMYFYIGRVQKALPGAADKKLTELLVGPALYTGQVMNAGAGDALVRLIKGFWAGEHPAALEPIAYDDFVADFLHYLDDQRETLGAEKFDGQYPLEGFIDWSQKRRRP